jgi:hypothetical protein
MFRRSAFSVVAAFLAFANLPASSAFAQASKDKPSPAASAADSPVDQLISWLLNEHRQMLGIPFAEVIFDTTGKRLLSVNPKDEIDQRVIKQIGAACDETIKRFNVPDNVIQSVFRINEVSSHFEDSLRLLLNVAPGFELRLSADGRRSRSTIRISRLANCRRCKQARFLSRSKALCRWKP